MNFDKNIHKKSDVDLNNLDNYLVEVPSGRFRVSSFPIEGGQLVELSLIIPTYNESKNIPHLIEKLSYILDQVLPNDYELIVVDDNSPDRCWEIAQSLISQYPQLRVMRRVSEKGLSTAVIRGWQVARGKILGVIDADLQHPPEILLQLLTAMRNNADIALASRYVGKGGVSDWSFIRRFLSRGAQLLGLVILPEVLGRVSDPMSGYFLVHRSAIAECTLNPSGYKILLEVLGRGKIHHIAEVAYVFQERLQGESKVTWKQYVEYIQHLLRLRFSRGKINRIKQRINFPNKRFLQFCLVGLTGVFVDMLLLYILHDPSFLGLGLTRSKIFAAEVAIINNFVWNDAWTFNDLSRQQKGWLKRLERFLKFNFVCLMGLILNVLVLNLLFNLLGVHYLVANVMAIAIVTFWNFWINLKLSWRSTDTK
ncbi:glycosyltransferase [Nostoc linckia FACHB-104]|nr:glycosyltransferase [Nostoc linckia FACHB-104]